MGKCAVLIADPQIGKVSVSLLNMGKQRAHIVNQQVQCTTAEMYIHIQFHYKGNVFTTHKAVSALCNMEIILHWHIFANLPFNKSFYYKL